MRRPAPLARPRFLNFPSYDWFSGTSITCLGRSAGADRTSELSLKAHPGITVMIGRKTHRSQRTASGVFRLAPACLGPSSPSNPSEGLRQRETQSHARLSRAVIGSRSCQSKLRTCLHHGPAPSWVRAAIGWVPQARLSIGHAHGDVTTRPRGPGPGGFRAPPGVSGPATPGPARRPRTAPARPGLVHGEVDLRSQAVHRLALWGEQRFRSWHRAQPGRPRAIGPAPGRP